MDIYGETYIFSKYLLELIKKVRGVENVLKRAPTLQLQGGSLTNKDQYTLVQLCAKFGAFNKILLKSAVLIRRL